MTMYATLQAEKREATGKGAARKIRAAGRVPAVVYGQGGEAVAVTLDGHEALRLFQTISVENTLVDLSLDGESIQTLVREVQVHPLRPGLLHVDFYRVQKGVKLEVEIPIHLHGTPAGVKSQGGVLQQVIHDLLVLTLPSLIPESFEVDVSGLELGDSIHVADLDLPEGVEVQLEGDRTVCSVVIPRGLDVDEDEEAEDDLEEGAEPERIGEDEGDSDEGSEE
jgi:large subunit ribosomal protein L25